MNKTAILLFGAFNPLTYAHMKMAGILYLFNKDADIWYIPANSKYIHNKMDGEIFLTDEERLRTLKESVERPDAHIPSHVSDIEITGVVDGKTYNTVQYFKEVLGYEKVYICMGSDNLENLHNWYRADDLTRENEFIVFKRGDRIAPPLTREFHYILGPKLGDGCSRISSSLIRRLYKKHNDLSDIELMVPPPVYELLEQKMIEEMQYDGN